MKSPIKGLFFVGLAFLLSIFPIKASDTLFTWSGMLGKDLNNLVSALLHEADCHPTVPAYLGNLEVDNLDWELSKKNSINEYYEEDIKKIRRFLPYESQSLSRLECIFPRNHRDVGVSVVGIVHALNSIVFNISLTYNQDTAGIKPPPPEKLNRSIIFNYNLNGDQLSNSTKNRTYFDTIYKNLLLRKKIEKASSCYISVHSKVSTYSCIVDAELDDNVFRTLTLSSYVSADVGDYSVHRQEFSLISLESVAISTVADELKARMEQEKALEAERFRTNPIQQFR